MFRQHARAGLPAGAGCERIRLMDFFEHQSQARKKTGWLVACFLMAVVGIIGVLHVVFALIFGASMKDPQLFASVAIGVMVLVAIGSLVKIIELSRGGRVVAAMLGGEPISPQTRDLARQRLMNIVEEMAIASGVPVPDVYALPDVSINAFAAGHGPADTVIGVTTGAIERLSRDELQGVIAHEFSHILHGDMRLNIRLMGLLNGILVLALLGGLLLRATLYMPRDSGGSREDRKNGAGLVFALLAAGLALYLVGWIGVFFGNLIKAGVSRQREFLADASAVQYTRNPSGIAGALYKISRLSGRLTSPRAAEASHMFFGNGLADPWIGLFATHPPVAERIAAIAPDFDPSSVDLALTEKQVPPPPPPPPPLPQEPAQLPISKLFEQSAIPQSALGAALLDALPAFARTSSRETHSAVSLVYALLLSDDANRRAVQMESLDAPVSVREETMDFFGRREEIADAGRIALVDLVIPTLRQLSDDQYRYFRANVQRLIEQDGQIDLFEFVLQKVLLRHLDVFFSQSARVSVKYRSVAPLMEEVSALLGGIALVGHGEPSAREEAYRAGLCQLDTRTASLEHPLLPEACDLSRIDAALDRLAEAAPDVKRVVLTACAEVAAHDGMINAAEYELLRAIADAVDCPLPPLPPPLPSTHPSGQTIPS